MGRDLDLPLAERLAKLIRLLGSDRDGEIVATVGAIKRALEGAGLDLHTLAQIVKRDLDKETETNTAYPPSWYRCAKFCEGRADRLNARERDFVRHMVLWTARGREPSDKQGRWLDHLFVRLGGILE